MFRIGDQLELSLDDVRLQRVVVPWSGSSPRVLTKAWKRFSLETQGGGHEVDLGQYEMFEKFGREPIQKKRVPGYLSGAPSLRSLPRKGLRF